MDFGYTEAQEMFAHSMRQFAQKELAPGAKERAKKYGIPQDILKKMAGMGLTSFNLPEKYGGQPLDYVSVGIATEEVAKADFNLALTVPQSTAFGMAIKLGSEEIQAEWVPPVAQGESMVSIAITEPGMGSDAAALQTRAVREGDYYYVQGEKTSITFGTQSKVGLIFVKTDPTQRARGVSCLLVPLESPGVSRSLLPDTGCRPIGRASISFDRVQVPAKYLLGGEGKGFYLVMSQFDFIRINLALMCLGIAQTSLNEAMNYAKQRTAFGKPIAKFEGISFKIAEDYTFLEAGRLLCYKALWLHDQGQSHIKESAMCKWFCPYMAVKVVHDALLIHGHFAYSEELPLEQRLRDVIGLELADGSADIMKVVISRELMGREFLPY